VTGQKFCGAPINVPITLPAAPAGDVRVEAFEACTDGSKQRPVYAPVQVRYNFRDNESLWSTTPGYATTSSANDTIAGVTFKGLLPGRVDVIAQDPRTKQWRRTTDVTRTDGGNLSTVVNKQTTVFRFRFNMECKVVTGGSGG
jgi:hypothetical protein